MENKIRTYEWFVLHKVCRGVVPDAYRSGDPINPEDSSDIAYLRTEFKHSVRKALKTGVTVPSAILSDYLMFGGSLPDKS